LRRLGLAPARSRSIRDLLGTPPPIWRTRGTSSAGVPTSEERSAALAQRIDAAVDAARHAIAGRGDLH
jgi:hypothetical protein